MRLIHRNILSGLIAMVCVPLWSQDPPALLQAARAGDAVAVQRYLSAGADPNSTDPSGISALMMAAAEGHKDIAKAFIGAGADVNHQSDDGWTALLMASFRGYNEVVRLLLENGADPKAKNKDGLDATTLAEHAGHKGISELFVDPGNPRVDPVVSPSKALITFRSDMDAGLKINGRLVHVFQEGNGVQLELSFGEHLVQAISMDEQDRWEAQLTIDNAEPQVVLIDLAKKAEVGWRLRNRMTEAEAVALLNARNIPIDIRSLCNAAEYGDRRAVEALLIARVDPNGEDARGISRFPLWLAALNGDAEIVKALLAAGADPNAIEADTVDAAVVRGHLEVVKLLLQAGADFDRQRLYERAGDNVAIRKLLMSHKKSQADAFREAVEFGDPGVVQEMIKEGADVDAQYQYGRVPLMLALFKRNTDAVRILLEAGANPNAVDNQGHSVLKIAVMFGDAEARGMLEHHGAKESP